MDLYLDYHLKKVVQMCNFPHLYHKNYDHVTSIYTARVHTKDIRLICLHFIAICREPV